MTEDSSGLAGRTAVVTGASRGIGLGIARRLIDEGANVVITARKEEALNEAVKGLGERARGVAGKADDDDHRAAAIATATEAFGTVDILVNNAGINPVAGALADLDLGAARKILDVNLVGALGWTQRAIKDGGMTAGSVINICSVAGITPSPGIAFYGVSKAALSHLTACLAVELGPGIRVNAVAPAVVKTRFATPLYEGREAEVAEAYPLRRLGVPEDVAGAVAFLVSDAAAWITGQTLVLDGGLTLTGRVGA
ncbi:NAD(P)-dependent dehydrogenase (short-subunit alcohol dehydrogenase family) [Catenuloplanes nepalensis]|uniref:NAD(P)-dependent dehydrogenase (Short-subunit alcohol dehydrogenase family) n=1 Tax=Catenuloplanes nepalensis TaxID=587533 RepID=A0ABT9MVX6_9ACTN|nr:SDR family oxidoreductase [Catenuloplanes nepalensis]MDP9795597.1 NAD(P)-dependent dehydrogenase (short-subunit alcohol dehydrogenase family) [Catenuloplanes nepalensis]